MNRWMLAREAAELVLMGLSVAAAAVLMVAAGSCLVGGRAPSPSPGVPHASRADSGAAPARPPAATTEAVSVGGGNGEDGRQPELADFAPRSQESGSAAPASSVTRSALSAVPTATAVVNATKAVTALSKETGAELYQLIAASPWPQYLWGTVACLVQRESGGLPWIVSPGGDVGLMQVGPANFAFLSERGITRAMLFDGATNLAAGWILYVWWQSANGDGLTPWASTRGGCA